MKIESNKRAIIALLMLVLTSVIIFLTEKKYLVAKPRGGTLSNYEKITWTDKILLLIDDFEGLNPDSLSLVKAKLFSFGSAKLSIDHSQIDSSPIAAKSVLKLEWEATDNFGGWGKGVGANMNLDVTTNYFNFRVYVPKSNGNEELIKIILQEDDNDDGVLQEDKDDFWIYKINVPGKDEWQFISIPLKNFGDENKGGDGIFNVTKKRGLHNIVFSFEQPEKYTKNHQWYFDFICFSSEKIIEK